MKYYLIFDPYDTKQAYAIAQDNPKYRSRWASSIPSLFTNLSMEKELPTSFNGDLPPAIADQHCQILATFDTFPTLALLEATHPELLL